MVSFATVTYLARLSSSASCS